MILVLTTSVLEITRDQDTVLFRNRLKELATKIGMSLVNQTKLITAASELVRNMLRYANGGKVTMEVISRFNVAGIRLVFDDKGPGIKDLELAMKDGYSTGKSLGMGLPGAKRLVNEFHITSKVGEGTSVAITKWKNG